MHPPLPLASDDQPVVRPPRLPGHVVMRPSRDDAIDAALAEIYLHAANCIGAFGDFQFAVCASPAAEDALRRLMFDPNLRAFPWHKTRLWLTDELVLPEGDERLRGRTLHDIIVAQSDIPREQVHTIPTWESGAQDKFERTLREVLGWREKGHDRLDVVLVVLDETGALAGLTRGSPTLDEMGRLVATDLASEPGRVSMSLPLLNATRLVSILAVGAPVQGVIREIEAAGRAVRLAECEIPVSRLKLVGGDLRWYVDAESLAGRD